jgi:hypothetical protein
MSDHAPRVVSGAYRAKLGECPLFDARRQCLWFVDIIAPAILRINAAADAPDDGVRCWRLPNWCARARAPPRAFRYVPATHTHRAFGRRVGCIALRAPQDDKEEDNDAGGATLLAALARDEDDHTGGVLCALRLNDGEEHAVCEALTELPLQPNRRARTHTAQRHSTWRAREQHAALPRRACLSLVAR